MLPGRAVPLLLLTLSASTGCDAGPQALEPPPRSPAPVLVQATWSGDAQPPDAVLLDHDSVTIRRTYPEATCCPTRLVPTLTTDDSTLHLVLESPGQLGAPPGYPLRLTTTVRRGDPRWRRLVQELRYPAGMVLRDTIALPPAPRATLPALQIAAGFAPLGAIATPTAHAAYLAPLARLTGTALIGGYDPWFRVALAPRVTATTLVLPFCCGGGPFPAQRGVNFDLAVVGLPAGQYQVSLGYAGREQQVGLTVPAAAP